MSSDIQLFYEARRDDRWVSLCLPPEPEDGWQIMSEKESYEYFDNIYSRHPAFVDRNYVLFSVLANVRNRFGIVPISQPRGLPEGTSKDVLEKWSQIRTPFYTSWVFLGELINYPWSEVMGLFQAPDEPLYFHEIHNFVINTLPFLQSLVEDPKDLRLVFWFDN